MARDRKKPIVIEATQWQPGLDIAGVRRVPAQHIDASRTRGISYDRPERHVVDTLHGPIDVSPGDWIITGVKGEKYPCKPDVFALTYESADAVPAGGVAAQEGGKLVLGPRLKAWLSKASVWGQLVRTQQSTLSKRALLNMMIELTEQANDLLIENVKESPDAHA